MTPPAPTRIQLSRRKGWRLPEGAVKVDRTTRWGNPFIVGVHGTRAACVEQYRILLGHRAINIGLGKEMVDEQQATLTAVLEHGRTALAGRDLACWCPLAAPCHADVLLAFVNGARIDATVLYSLHERIEFDPPRDTRPRTTTRAIEE